MGQAKKRGDFETRKQAALSQKLESARQAQDPQLRSQAVQNHNDQDGRVRIVSADSELANKRVMAEFAAAMKAGHFIL